jgi:MYXO-CTERM domain-containing protein
MHRSSRPIRSVSLLLILASCQPDPVADSAPDTAPASALADTGLVHAQRIARVETAERRAFSGTASFTEDGKLTASDGARSDKLGYAVGGAGDVNGDGYDDIVVGALQDSTAAYRAGAVYLYLGSSAGVDASTEHEITASDADSTDQFGELVSGAGDVNGDGYADIIVGADQDDDAGTSSGAAYLYFGSSTGVDSASEVKVTASDADASDSFGRPAALDIDGDGYSDLLIGAPYNDDDGTNSGSAYIFSGGSGGLGSETKYTASDAVAQDCFGMAVANAGDVDGDGYGDALVAAPYNDDVATDAGAVYVYLGSATGLDAASEIKLYASDGSISDSLGKDVEGVGDLDGDGHDDIALGAYGDDDQGVNAGSVYVFFGSSGGIDSASETKVMASDGASYNYFGWVMAGQDLDGDGYSELLVGAYGDDTAGAAAGAVYVYSGGSGGLGSESKIYASDASSNDYFGRGVSGAGDVDGDGFGDLVVGASGEDDMGSDAGAAYVFLGTASVTTWYADSDGDGFGDPSVTTTASSAPSGYVADSSDCDDGDATIKPGATELCDGVDNDCDGSVDEAGATGAATWYADSDGDGFGDASSSIEACSAPSGHVADATDCDDDDATIKPSATELCDGVDNDCDGAVDNDADDAPTWYADSDGDGFGDPDATSTACAAPSDHVDNATDCDDGDGSINPDATELCDGVDNDCDTATDEDDAADAGTWCADQDADGFTLADDCVEACEAPEGYTEASATNDCDDSDSAINPDASEIPDDGIDQDCDGQDLTTDPGDTGDGGAKDGGCSTAGGQPYGIGWLLVGLALLGSRRRRYQLPSSVR